MNQPASTSVAPSPSPAVVKPGKLEPTKNIPLELIELTDRDTIVWLIYNEVRWTRKERKVGYKTIFWFERSCDLVALLERWQSPEPLLVDARKWLQAERLFNSAVKDQF